MKQRPGDERTVLDESADPAERASALMRLASDGRSDLISVARQWLNGENPFLRGEAITMLISFWASEEEIPAVMHLLEEDPDPEVRGAAARSLSTFVLHRQAKKDEILRALVRQLESDDDAVTQSSCYEALLRCIDETRPQARFPFDRDRDVDWQLLAPWRRH